MKEYNFIALMCKHLIGIISPRLQFGPTCIDCRTLNYRSQTKSHTWNFGRKDTLAYEEL